MATPIGHLADLSPRAAQTLREVDVVAAEDTRVSRVLLQHTGSSARLISARAHNEQAAARQILALLAQGKSVALVSDAGTPAISDPGAPSRGWQIFLGIVTLIAGVVVLAYPFSSLATLTLVVGVWLIVIGVFEIVASFGIRKTGKEVRTAVGEALGTR